MTNDIQSLIEKINEEGVIAAEAKAVEIENRAKSAADEIIKKARLEAENITRQASERIAKTEEKQKVLLTQAARDILLSLRKEINAALDKVIIQEVRQVLSSQKLLEIISKLINDAASGAKSDIAVSLGKDDMLALEKTIFAKLKEEIKKGVVLRPAEDISAGFTISFDSGKSCFDFSDKALVEYIGVYLKPKLAELLKSV